MKKNLLAILLMTVGIVTGTSAQTKFFTKTGTVSFFSSTAMEDISATNSTTTSVFDPASGNMEFALLVKAFQFEKALMQEHFNENYMESDQFPKSTFKGKVSNMGNVNLNMDGEYPVTVKGQLTMHGVTKEIEVPGIILVKEGAVFAKSTFNVSCSDYGIDIPKLVEEKIAKSIEVKVDIKYEVLKTTGTN